MVMFYLWIAIVWYEMRETRSDPKGSNNVIPKILYWGSVKEMPDKRIRA